MQVTFKRYLAMVLLFGLVGSAAASSELANHPSPYLRLHAEDPVEWQLWGREVLDGASKQNRLVYLSIGYFSCHWCHVMQRESYRDPEVGEFLNAHFIPVKVDRELHPQLDRRMIRFVEALSGVAGWPLNVFLTADGYPVTGFTYLPRDDFLEVLQRLDEQWQQRGAEIRQSARIYFEHSERDEARDTLLQLPAQQLDKVVDAFVAQAMLIADEMQGGFGSTTKFPSYPQMKVLLAAIADDAEIDRDVVRFARLTLDAMAEQHLMDQVNGGFFRYVTDPDWQTPHFEKMLYDNAQLAQLYFQAHELWPERGYDRVGLRTVAFMQSFLGDGSGGLNASLSAVDEQDQEGGAYYWSAAELRKVLTAAEYRFLDKELDLTSERSVLIPPLVKGAQVSAEERRLRQGILARLKAAERPVMPVDAKKLAVWNALALRALLAAERFATDSKAARQESDRLYRFIRQHFVDRNGVRRLAGSSAHAETTLADYAHLASALQAYADQRSDREAARQAIRLAQQAFERYFRDGAWIQDTHSLIPGERGERVIRDGVLESPLSLLLAAVLSSGAATPALQAQAREQLEWLTRDMLDLPFHYASAIWLRYRYRQDASTSG